MIVAPRRRGEASRPPRPPAERPSVWPLICSSPGSPCWRRSSPRSSRSPIGERLRRRSATRRAGRGKPVTLSGVARLRPVRRPGTSTTRRCRLATDRNPATYWTTEHYQSFTRRASGSSSMLGPRRSSKVTVQSDTPGFTAEIESGSSPLGRSARSRLLDSRRRRTDFSERAGRSVLRRLDHRPRRQRRRARQPGQREELVAQARAALVPFERELHQPVDELGVGTPDASKSFA